MKIKFIAAIVAVISAAAAFQMAPGANADAGDVPMAPDGLTVSTADSGYTLNWMAVVGADAYNIYENDVNIATVDVSSFTSDSGPLLAGTRLKVTACRGGGNATECSLAPDAQAKSVVWEGSDAAAVDAGNKIVGAVEPRSTGGGMNAASICGGDTVFLDDFAGNTIDGNKWKSGLYWGHQNSTGAEVGTYVEGTTDARVFEQSGGTLKIRSTKDGNTYYTGALTALDNSTPTFGQGCYEARMKFPVKGNGTWPALWLISNTGGPDAQRRPEIDVIEHVGSEPAVPQFAAHQLGNAPNFQTKFEADGPETDASQFHNYAVVWGPNGVTWFFDGQPVENSTAATTNVPMYLHLNMAMGGDWAKFPSESLWAGGPPTMEIDWIKVTK